MCCVSDTCNASLGSLRSASWDQCVSLSRLSQSSLSVVSLSRLSQSSLSVVSISRLSQSYLSNVSLSRLNHYKSDPEIDQTSIQHRSNIDPNIDPKIDLKIDIKMIKNGPSKKRTHKTLQMTGRCASRPPKTLITSTFLSLDLSTVSVFSGVDLQTSHAFASPNR